MRLGAPSPFGKHRGLVARLLDLAVSLDVGDHDTHLPW